MSISGFLAKSPLHLPVNPAVGQDVTRSSGFGEPFCSQKQLIPPEVVRPHPAQQLHMLHITRGSVPADPAAPCKEAAMGLESSCEEMPWLQLDLSGFKDGA